MTWGVYRIGSVQTSLNLLILKTQFVILLPTTRSNLTSIKIDTENIQWVSNVFSDYYR